MLRLADDTDGELAALLTRYDITLESLALDADITSSFWGAPEAGIVGQTVYARPDTPLHSILHEAAHVICMPAERRAVLERDAGGDDLEEAAVCFLQIVLADHLEGVGVTRLMADMDTWGYSFRLGSTARWFAEDSGDARRWLEERGLLTAMGQPTFRLCR